MIIKTNWDNTFKTNHKNVKIQLHVTASAQQKQSVTGLSESKVPCMLAGQTGPCKTPVLLDWWYYTVLHSARVNNDTVKLACVQAPHR
jgi:hypothetical protein